MKAAALAAEELTAQVAHRLMALAGDPLVPSGGSEVVPDIHVYDDVLPDPEGYRALALAHTFRTFTIGNVEWHGFAECEPTGFTDWLQDRRPDLTATLSLLRQSPEGQVEPHYIHTDRSMGEWTAILYLTPSPQTGDGTDFWRHRWSGVTESRADPRLKWCRKPRRGVTRTNGPCDNMSRLGSIVWSCFRRNTSIHGPCMRTMGLATRPD